MNRRPFAACCTDTAPVITLAPSDQKVVESGMVTFICQASGYPTPDMSWRRAGRRITSNQPRRYTVLTDQQSGTTVLRIDPVRPRRDDHVFECVAENGVGEPANATAQLQVYPGEEGI